MPQVEFSELPDDIRVRLTEEGEKELWHRVDEFGGVKAVSDSFGFSQSGMYNWRNRELALPVRFVRKLMGENSTYEITLLKGGGVSGSINNPRFPLVISDELLTRLNLSVKENSEGTPVYLTSERSLVNRFTELLGDLGDVEYRVYSRESRFEVRYPKFLHNLLLELEYSRHLGAMTDEEGEIKDTNIVVGDRKIPIDGFDQELYSKEKRFELALQRENSEKIAGLMAEESSKVRKMIEGS